MATPNYVNLRSSLETDPVRNFRFLAKFTNISDPGSNAAAVKLDTSIGFTQISGLTVTTESIPYREGGYNTNVHQIPGQTSFSPLTFTRGVVLGTNQNWLWMKRLFDISAGTNTSKGQFRTTIDISVLKHPGHNDTNNVALRFKVYNAWITSVAYSDLNAGDNALMVEQMSVVHEGFEMTWADNYATGNASTTFPS